MLLNKQNPKKKDGLFRFINYSVGGLNILIPSLYALTYAKQYDPSKPDPSDSLYLTMATLNLVI